MSDDIELYAYRNKNTTTVHVFDEPNADLEARPNFESVPLDQVPAHMVDAARRARAGRQSVHQAGLKRMDPATHAAAAREAGPGDPPSLTQNDRQPVGTHGADGVLARTGSHNVQIGAEPWRHPASEHELRHLAAAESANPDPRGILDRGREVDGPGSPSAVAAALSGSTPPSPIGDAAPATHGQSAGEVTDVSYEGAPADGELEADATAPTDPPDTDPAAAADVEAAAAGEHETSAGTAEPAPKKAAPAKKTTPRKATGTK